MAVVSALWAAGHLVVHYRRSDAWLKAAAGQSATAHHVLTALLAGGAAFALSGATGADQGLVILALLIATLTLGYTGLRESREREIYLAELGLVACYLYLRLGTGLADMLEGWDAILMAVLAFGLLGLGEASRRADLEVLSRPALTTSLLLPAGALAVHLAARQLDAGLLAAMATVYLTHHLLTHRRRTLIAAAVLYNSALFSIWQRNGWTDPQLYLIPVGLTANLLAHVYRHTLTRESLHLIRYGAASLIFGVSFYQSILTPWNSLLLILLAVAGVGAGMVLRIRSYLYLGTGFVVAGVLMNLARFGLSHREFWAINLTLLGLAILSAMVVFSWKRAEIRSAMARVKDGLEGWE
jgi:hypothetical protein